MANLRQSGANTGTDTSKGFHWDEAIVYAPHSKWYDSPAPVFWQGPVYRSISGLAAALGKVAHSEPAAQGREVSQYGH